MALHGLIQDLGRGFRSLRQGGVATVFVVASLALGVAGSTAAFSLVRAWLLKPLPYPEPERLVLLGEREEDSPELIITSLFSSLATWADYRERSRTLEEWSAFVPIRVAFSEGDRSVPVMAARVTPGFLRTMGARVVRGRGFDEAEAGEGGPAVAVVAGEFVRTRMPGVAEPLGATLLLDGVAHEVVGVLEDGFEFIVPNVRIWLPLRHDPATVSRSARWTISVARMAPGATMPQVEAEVAGIAARIAEEYPATNRGWTADPINMRTEFPEPQTRMYLALIQGVTLFVLLIACANIISLLLARAEARRRELAIRAALGAGGGRILRQLVAESMALALVGGALGVGLAAALLRPTQRAAGEVVMGAWLPTVDAPVLGFALAVTMLCGLVFGVVPGLEVLRGDLVGTLKTGGRSGGGRRSRRMLQGLVVAEVALCLVALGAGSVLVQSFLESRRFDPGYERAGLLALRIEIPGWKHAGEPERWQLLEQLRQRASAVRGVEGVALANTLPENLLASTDTFHVPGAPADPGARAPRAISVRATPGYRETLGIPLLRGRFLTDADREGSAPVVVISRTLAERRFGGDGVGRQIEFLGRTREVVGVVGDVVQTLAAGARKDPEETIYVPMAQDPRVNLYLVARAAGDPKALEEPLRAAVFGVDPDNTVEEVTTLEEFASRFLVLFDLFNALFVAVGAFAVMLACLGTYGLVAYGVRQREHEIGVRAALGATARQIVYLFAWRGVRLALLGLALGVLLLVPVLFAVSAVLQGLFLPPVRPAWLVLVGLLLFTATAAASVLPARRAADVEPLEVLRQE